MKHIVTIVGGKSQSIKAAVISKYLKDNSSSVDLNETLIYTGQHIENEMSDKFFKELEVSTPSIYLGVGNLAERSQFGEMLTKIEENLDPLKPDAVLVYGDTRTTLAAAMASSSKNIPLIHVEAGERIYRRTDIPEEVNRVLTDNLASLCLTGTKKAYSFLCREGFAKNRIEFVGDPMFDLFIWGKSKIDIKNPISFDSHVFTEGEYYLATLDRQHTQSKKQLLSFLEAMDNLGAPVLLPAHPGVRDLLKKWQWNPKNNLIITEPLGYFDFLKALLSCNKVITDSVGVVRDAFFAGKPSIVLMKNCRWSEIVESGWAVEVGSNMKLLKEIVEDKDWPTDQPKGLFGEGESARKIVSGIEKFLNENRNESAWHQHGSIDDLPKNQFTDFTYGTYREMIDKFKSNDYKFISFNEAEKMLKSDKKFILMRHDIDFEPEKALMMAQVEEELGISSTYFFMIRTPHYNIFSSENSDLLTKIIDMGHYVGLHMDCSAYQENPTIEELAAFCSIEKEIFQKWFDMEVSIVSFHRPNRLVLSGDPRISAPLKHTYMPLFFKGIKYYSDSTGRWKYGNPLESDDFKKKLPMHILVHPIWWNENPSSAYETLLKYSELKHDQLEESIAQNCSIYKVGTLMEGNRT